MTWLLIGKMALLSFLVLCCTVLVVTFVRNARRVGPLRYPNPYASGYLDLIHGGVPPTPLPQWVDWPGADEYVPEH
ncbi:hypothetical protein ACQI5H_23195 [Mycobacterium heidelbergense]|uniref:hypothetical protein n=1 Tax=Mycobacterium heidelbergense TaxID=53376 RepID=UPI003CE7AF9B